MHTRPRAAPALTAGYSSRSRLAGPLNNPHVAVVAGVLRAIATGAPTAPAAAAFVFVFIYENPCDVAHAILVFFLLLLLLRAPRLLLGP